LLYKPYTLVWRLQFRTNRNYLRSAQDDQRNSAPDHRRDRNGHHDALCRSEVIAPGGLIRRGWGVPCRRLPAQQHDEVWICEFNSAGATPLLARPSARRGGFSVVVSPFYRLAQAITGCYSTTRRTRFVEHMHC
jgi:hypothetical protein